jgi:glucosylglycerate synthase
MATANPLPETTSDSAKSEARLLVLLPELPADQMESVLANLASCATPGDLLIATPEEPARESHPELRIIASAATRPSWTITAADYVNAFQLAQENHARGILMLGPECSSLGESGLRDLANAVIACPTDLAIPRYDLPANAGLVNSAILYPLSRALFASSARFPLAVDLGLSMRMAERLSAAAQRFKALNQSGALLWPVNEAVAAGFAIHECYVGPRDLPHPAEPDLNTILPMVTGSLFADIESKAAFWQRPRQAPPARNNSVKTQAATVAMADIGPMLQAFRLAYTNLLEVWSLVLPPNSLLGLKRLSVTDGEAFRMPETLWARIVFDFLLSYRLRTINRGHLLGALIPLYLAWVASYINITASGVEPECHIATVAAAFEAEKPYIVSRWRWPDRFNP